MVKNMTKFYSKIRPESGFTHFLYVVINALLPVLVLVFVRLQFVPIAIILLFLAKWRILAVKPRYWFANVRSNLVDLFVGLSVVSFMASTNNFYTQLAWTVLFVGWIVWLKPKSQQIAVIAQALVAQTLSLIAFYQAFPEMPIIVSVLGVWLICLASARHFLGVFEEDHTKQLANLWAWFGAVLAWILGHWVIFYMGIPQIALILTAISYGMGIIYYLSANDSLKQAAKNQIIVAVGIILLIIIVFSDWQDKTI